MSRRRGHRASSTSPASDAVRALSLSDADVTAASEAYRCARPFAHTTLRSFLTDKFARELSAELRTIEYYAKRSDLYSLSQSDELKRSKKRRIAQLRSALYGGDMRRIIARITGADITDGSATVDMSANAYVRGDFLLCHDDRLSSRRVAFILYLVPPDWSDVDGGHLDLLAADADGFPAGVTTSLLPAFNSFTFFEVSAASYHAVREVVADGRVRLSISGWYHSANNNVSALSPSSPPTPASFGVIQGFDGGALGEWISAEYLSANALTKVRARFLADSAVTLIHFVRRDVLAAIKAELSSAQWRRCGPANYRRFGIIDDAHTAPAPSTTRDFMRFLQSALFAGFLRGIVDMILPRVRLQCRRFGSGDYTLANDEERDKHAESLDVNLCILSGDDDASSSKPKRTTWAHEYGGGVHYIVEGERDELLHLRPTDNALSIVYRAAPDDEHKSTVDSPSDDDADGAFGDGDDGGGGVLRFVQFISVRAGTRVRYDIDVVYHAE